MSIKSALESFPCQTAALCSDGSPAGLIPLQVTRVPLQTPLCSSRCHVLRGGGGGDPGREEQKSNDAYVRAEEGRNVRPVAWTFLPGGVYSTNSGWVGGCLASGRPASLSDLGTTPKQRCGHENVQM